MSYSLTLPCPTIFRALIAPIWSTPWSEKFMDRPALRTLVENFSAGNRSRKWVMNRRADHGAGAATTERGDFSFALAGED